MPSKRLHQVECLLGKKQFSIKDFFSICYQIRRKLYQIQFLCNVSRLQIGLLKNFNNRICDRVIFLEQLETVGQSYILNCGKFEVEIFKREQRYNGRDFNAVIDPSIRHAE